MANENRLIDVMRIDLDDVDISDCTDVDDIFAKIEDLLDAQPIVDAVELPKGKPGDYLEWDNGTGFRQIYYIYAVMICEDCMRYDLEEFTPAVNHKNIVRIMSREEAKVALAKMNGDGNAER